MKREIKCHNLSLNKCSLRPECLAVVISIHPQLSLKIGENLVNCMQERRNSGGILIYILFHIHENKVSSLKVLCSDVHIPHFYKNTELLILPLAAGLQGSGNWS